MTTGAYDFDQQLAMSQGRSATRDVREILLTEVPGALAAHPAATENDRNGTDWWVEHASGRHLSIDCKVRDVDWRATHPAEDDLALESWSVTEAKKVGWTRDPAKRTDYILWLWLDTGRWCLVPFPMLCTVFVEHWERWRSQYKTRVQESNRGNSVWHSECIFVPRREVWAAIYRRFSGDLVKAAGATR